MADVREIFGITKANQKTDSVVPTFKKRKRSGPPLFTDRPKKRQSGLRREIEQLKKGEPTIAPAQPKIAEFKEKRKVIQIAERWKWKGFTNSARTDNAVFYHWVKAAEPQLDYKFASFNKKPLIYEYNDELYKTFFENKDWTRGETDYLFDLCKTFDIRWIVVHDRWEFGTEKTIEDMKDRFYSIQKKLVELSGDKNFKKSPYLKEYNKEQEIIRKRQLEELYKRDKNQVEEDEKLIESGNNLLVAFARRKKSAPKIISLAQKLIMPPRENKGRRGRGRNRANANNLVKTVNNLFNFKKYQTQISEAMVSLGISKSTDVPNSKYIAKLNNVKALLVILFELQKIQAEAHYELQVKSEHKNLLLESKRKRLGLDEGAILEDPEITMDDQQNMIIDVEESSSVSGMEEANTGEDEEKSEDDDYDEKDDEEQTEK